TAALCVIERLPREPLLPLALFRVLSRPPQDVLRRLHAGQHLRRDRFGLAVIVDVDVEPVHYIESRIAEELLQSRAPDVLAHLRVEKCTVIRFEIELVDRRQLGRRRIPGYLRRFRRWRAPRLLLLA